MFRCNRFAVAFLIIAAFTAGRASAQRTLLQPGVHVRLPGIGQGIIARPVSDSIYLLMKGGAYRVVPLNAIPSIEVRGDKNRVAGARRGTIWGGGITLLIGVGSVIAGDSTDCKYYSETGSQVGCSRKWGAGDVVLITAGGVLMGAGIGALIGRREWHSVQLTADASPEIQILPSRRIAFAVRLR